MLFCGHGQFTFPNVWDSCPPIRHVWRLRFALLSRVFDETSGVLTNTCRVQPIINIRSAEIGGWTVRPEVQHGQCPRQSPILQTLPAQIQRGGYADCHRTAPMLFQAVCECVHHSGSGQVLIRCVQLFQERKLGFTSSVPVTGLYFFGKRSIEIHSSPNLPS